MAVLFDPDIKALFRSFDRQSMRRKFDLWDYQDVSTHADLILEKVETGSMPCDSPWTPDKVSLFRQWIDEGKKT